MTLTLPPPPEIAGLTPWQRLDNILWEQQLRGFWDPSGERFVSLAAGPSA